MATTDERVKELLGALGSISGITVKKMFGGVGFFKDGVMFGMLAQGVFRLKVHAGNQADFEKHGMKPYFSDAKKKGMPYWEVPEKILTDGKQLTAWAKRSMAEAAPPGVDVAALYEAAVRSIKEIEFKGKNMLYTSANGYMFSQVNKAGELGIRLSKPDQEKFIKAHGGEPFKSYGAVMKDHVLVPDTVLQDKKLLVKWLKLGLAHVMSLKPK